MSLEMKYFVLKPRSKYKGDLYAKASREAMLIYASVINKENPKMAANLIEWFHAEKNRDWEMEKCPK